MACWLAATTCAGASAADGELGRYLSAECVTCHQISSHVAGGVPQITGWPEEQFVAVMNSYKENHRDNPVMRIIAGRLAADDIAALAAYFGALAPKPGSK